MTLNYLKLAENGKIQNVNRNNFSVVNDRHFSQFLHIMKVNELQNSSLDDVINIAKMAKIQFILDDVIALR